MRRVTPPIDTFLQNIFNPQGLFLLKNRLSPLLAKAWKVEPRHQLSNRSAALKKKLRMRGITLQTS